MEMVAPLYCPQTTVRRPKGKSFAYCSDFAPGFLAILISIIINIINKCTAVLSNIHYRSLGGPPGPDF